MTIAESIHELGATRNQFGLLTQDSRVHTGNFMEFLGGSTNKAEVAKLLNVPRTSLYNSDSVRLPEKFIKEKLIPVVVAADLAVEIFNDLEKSRQWMITPNSYFFGKTPFEMCILGDGNAVITFLSNHLGRESANP